MLFKLVKIIHKIVHNKEMESNIYKWTSIFLPCLISGFDCLVNIITTPYKNVNEKL